MKGVKVGVAKEGLPSDLRDKAIRNASVVNNGRKMEIMKQTNLGTFPDGVGSFYDWKCGSRFKIDTLPPVLLLMRQLQTIKEGKESRCVEVEKCKKR